MWKFKSKETKKSVEPYGPKYGPGEICYKVAIDLVEDGSENICIMESPPWDTEEEALDWYRENYYGKDCHLDIIMVKYNSKGECLDSYIIE